MKAYSPRLSVCNNKPFTNGSCRQKAAFDFVLKYLTIFVKRLPKLKLTVFHCRYCAAVNEEIGSGYITCRVAQQKRARHADLVRQIHASHRCSVDETLIAFPVRAKFVIRKRRYDNAGTDIGILYTLKFH